MTTYPSDKKIKLLQLQVMEAKQMNETKKAFTCKQDEQGNFIKLHGMSCGYYNVEPMELEAWTEKTDDTHDLSSVEIMALFYMAVKFVKSNSEFFGIESMDDIDDSTAIQGGSVYLNNFEGYVVPLPDGTMFKMSRITYAATNDAIIACGYELDEDGYTTDNERAWLLT